jgi:hypothetical protein
MKTQRWICQFAVICPKSWNFQQHPLPSKDHNSWNICRVRVCQYSLERCQSYLQLLCSMLFLNLYHLRSAASFVTTAHSGQILSKRVKWNWSMCRLKFSPHLKGSWATLHLWTGCSCSSVREVICTLPQRQIHFQLSTEICVSFLFSYCDTLVLLTRVRRVRMSSKPEEVTYDIGFQCLLGSHFKVIKNSIYPSHFIQSRPEFPVATNNSQRS